MIEITGFVVGPDDEMVLSFFEEPFRGFVLDEDATLFYFAQFNDVTRGMRELLLALIRNEDSFNWINV